MAAGSKRYSAELKEDADDMVVQLVAHSDTEWSAMCNTADLLGVGAAETVRQWVRRVPTDGAGAAGGEPEGEIIGTLRQENAELKRANEILKAASASFAAEIDRPHRQLWTSSALTRGNG
ncbi:hypothetical protein LQL77_31645 [Rhodococcus cerastii]|nr:hypothetical protein [Rhodococcus cerastii]